MGFLLSEATWQTASMTANETGENATTSPAEPLTPDSVTSDETRFNLVR
jgi:hypothetical protein